MTTSRRHYLDDHPSVTASMEDFEAREFSPTIPDIPSQHSGFREATSEYSESEDNSRRSYSPPAWRKAGSGWFKHQQSLSPTRSGYASREVSPQYEDAEDGKGEVEEVTAAYPAPARIPLPESPTKGRSPSPSPAPRFGGDGAGPGGGANNARERAERETPATTPTFNNYIRLTTNLDILQQTEPIENAINACRKSFSHAVRNRYSTFTYFFGLLLAWWAFSALLRTPTTGPAPDLLKVAGMAKSFEPAIYYSEHGYAQIESLQETGVAVWDLGESVRSTNMTSAPLITGQLDQLSDSLKSLAVELTKFFATVDADIDSILLVMDWAQRELSTLTSDPPSKLSSVSSNMHAVLLKTGLIGRGELIADLFGQTRPQRARAMLERTFGDFLGVLEEAISGELTHSMKLLAFFEAIEKQFLNLQRTVVREQDTQEREESDFLSSLWTKVIGANAGRLRKYEKNKSLLHSIRDRTVRNKHVLVEHNGRLTQLQSNLEILRQRLVSPLVRSNDSSTLSVEAQIAGLQGTYDELRSSRERQKSKMMELIYGAGNRRRGIDGYGYAIEGSSS